MIPSPRVFRPVRYNEYLIGLVYAVKSMCLSVTKTVANFYGSSLFMRVQNLADSSFHIFCSVYGDFCSVFGLFIFTDVLLDMISEVLVDRFDTMPTHLSLEHFVSLSTLINTSKSECN